MAAIQLYSDAPNTMTNVPNLFIDEYMPDANGEFVKVYLYLLRCMENPAQDCSVSVIADRFNHTEKDVLRALKYWEKMHLLRLEYTPDRSICAIRFLRMEEAATDYAAEEPVPAPTQAFTPVPTSAQAPAFTPVPASVSAPAFTPLPASAQAPAFTPAPASAPAPTFTPLPASAPVLVPETEAPSAARREYTLEEVKAFGQDPEVSELFFIIETYLKHPLSSTDANTILYWYDGLQFSSELIVYLVEYCISKGHSSMRYMDKVAMGWNDSRITTVEQAKENAAIHSQAYYGVMKALGITGRSLVEAETAYITKWTKEYGFELPLIQEACRRTISAIHQPSFEYTDSILSSWHKNHVKTLDDVKNLDVSFNRTKKAAVHTDSIARNNKFNNFNQRSYDFDQLEAMMLTTSVPSAQ